MAYPQAGDSRSKFSIFVAKEASALPLDTCHLYPAGSQGCQQLVPVIADLSKVSSHQAANLTQVHQTLLACPNVPFRYPIVLPISFGCLPILLFWKQSSPNVYHSILP